jgi:hypothetical protein
MINKIQRKLSVKRFANGGIGLIAPPDERLMLPPGGSATRPIMPGMGGSGTVGIGGPGFGTRIPASVRSLKGFQQAALSAWPKIKGYGTLGLSTPQGRALWLASLGIPWYANQARKQADRIGETETISVNVSGIPRAIDIPVDSPVKQNVEAQAVTDLDKAFPGMSNSEIIEQSYTQSGIEIAPNQVEKVVNQVNENQIDNPDKPPQLDTTLVAENEEDNSPIVSAELNTAIEERDDQNKAADKVYWDGIAGKEGSGRSNLALSLNRTVSDILGPRGSKSKNLLLLQLAANLMSGRTDQPGFKGFLDVLGQAGQDVIPMAMSLNRAREEDEIEIKKALISAQGEAGVPWENWGGLVSFTDTSGKHHKGLPYRYNKNDGQMYAYFTDDDGRNGRNILVPAPDSTVAPADATTINKYSSNVELLTNALHNTNQFLDIAIQHPELIGQKGTVMKAFRKVGDIFKQWTGGLDYSTLVDQVKVQQDEALDNADDQLDKKEITPEDHRKLKNRILSYFDNFDKDKAIMAEGGPLAIQAKLRTIQLMTSYALANILKNKDRLAVQDIKRAEELTKVFGIGKDPTSIINHYIELKEQLTTALEAKFRKGASMGIGRHTIKELKAQAYGQTEINKSLSKKLDTLLASPNFDSKSGMEELLKVLNFDQIEVIGNENTSPLSGRVQKKAK